jgi:hypothetical protein
MLCIVEELREKDTSSLVASSQRPGFVRAGRLFNIPEGERGLLFSLFAPCLVNVCRLLSFTLTERDFMDTDYISHRIIRRIASWAVYSFFTEVRVIGGENVPLNGPIIVYVSLSRIPLVS